MNFDENKFLSEIARVFQANGLGSLLNMERSKKFLKLTDVLITENEKYNLTAITEPDKIILNHYADCAVLAARLPKGVKLADVGCGAGFPSLPIAILRPDVQILGIDSTAKRINYVNEVAKTLELGNVTAVTARAEDLGRGELRESFDVVTARAVAPMRILAELCLPLVKLGGKMIAMKGKNAAAELNEAKRAIAMCGGKILCTEDIVLKGADETVSHPLITIAKNIKTPQTYPRPYAQITKKPL